jgi:hypothetical protein
MVTSPATSDASRSGGPCRFCGTELRHTFVDLGMSPPCNFLPADVDKMEPFYPLHAYVCASCFLVQLQEYVTPESIFTEYSYFSSFSKAWLDHARDYVDMIVPRLSLGRPSQVIELASNDGYLLRNFVARDIPALGIEPAANIARVAEEQGIPTRVEFFDEEYAKKLVAEGLSADLIIGNNVLAQVPDLNSFVTGIRIALKPTGVVTLEFPQLMHQIAGNQFDQIYHEHFSYFSLVTIEKIFAHHGLRVFDADALWTHGGSIRVYGCLAGNRAHPESPKLAELREKERAAGILDLATYASFDAKARETKHKLLEFLIRAKREGKSVAGYGAPGKGNTLLNYCGIRTDFLDYTVDRNPYKIGRFTPGTHIPIYSEEKLRETRPDYILILPWNLVDEIVAQLAYTREWGARCVVPIPEVRICN